MLVGTRSGLVVLLGLLVAFPWKVRADDGDQARSFLNKATAAYGLGHYAVAAENFEKAYELRPDPALLYNAAQAHRLAGNKQRALELYQSYLRMYGKKDQSEEVERHIRDLKQAISRDEAVATAPPVTPAPVSVPLTPPAAPGKIEPIAVPPPSPATAPAAEAAAAPPPHSPPPAPPPPAAAPTTLVVESAPPPPESLTHKAWFWIVIGAGVAAAAAVTVLLATRGPNDAVPTLGTASGN
jgi:hypothetical protein